MGENLYLNIKEKCEKVFRGKYRIYDEDVIYDTMMSIILQYKKNSDHIQNFNAWVHGAIHFHYCTYLTNKNNNKVFTYDNLLLIENPCYDAYSESKIDSDLVKEEIENLKSPAGKIVELRLLEGFSHKDIAEKLKIKESAVRQHYSRSIKKIVRFLDYMPYIFIFSFFNI